MIQVKYIFHDCFVITSEDATMVFDFWVDPLQKDKALPEFISQADKTKPLYVFVSHFHKDHYSTSIFDWYRLFNNVKYIVSHDVYKRMKYIRTDESTYKGQKIPESAVIELRPGDEFKDENLRVLAFSSTDVGNSYGIELAGKTYFHSGDLNAWIWKDESTVAEVNSMLARFSRILDDIHAWREELDYVFFPVDSRIGTDYFTGAKMFIEKFKVSHFFPMHFGLGQSPEETERYEASAGAVQNYASPNCREYILLSKPYSLFAKY